MNRVKLCETPAAMYFPRSLSVPLFLHLRPRFQKPTLKLSLHPEITLPLSDHEELYLPVLERLSTKENSSLSIKEFIAAATIHECGTCRTWLFLSCPVQRIVAISASSTAALRVFNLDLMNMKPVARGIQKRVPTAVSPMATTNIFPEPRTSPFVPYRILTNVVLGPCTSMSALFRQNVLITPTSLLRYQRELGGDTGLEASWTRFTVVLVFYFEKYC